MADKKVKEIKVNNFIRDGLSIDETRVSVLIVSYIISFLATIAFCIYLRDVETLKAVFFANIAAITGVNVTNSIMTNVSKNNTTTVNTTSAGTDVPNVTGLPVDVVDVPDVPDVINTNVNTFDNNNDDWPRG